MGVDKETWKWGLVCILTAVLLIVGREAYLAVTTQEDFPPPEDYKMGDSYDLEHNRGPGAGQPFVLPADAIVIEAAPREMQNIQKADANESSATASESGSDFSEQSQASASDASTLDWNSIEDPGRH